MKISYFLPVIMLIIITKAMTAQTFNINVPDTVIPRGGVHSLPITGSYSGIDGKKIKISFKFNAYVLDIKGAGIEEAYGLSSVTDYSLNLSDLENAEAIIEGEIDAANFEGVLFELEVEGLAGPDTATALTPLSVIIETEAPETNFKSGRIEVDGTPVAPGITEGMSANRPNPFTYNTGIHFGLNKDSKIEFFIYTLIGRKILDSGSMKDVIKLTVIAEDGTQHTDFQETTFTRGNYLLDIFPYPGQLPAGPYYIVMKTVSGAYKSNFMYIK